LMASTSTLKTYHAGTTDNGREVYLSSTPCWHTP
jgi:hypothetical protein